MPGKKTEDRKKEKHIHNNTNIIINQTSIITQTSTYDNIIISTSKTHIIEKQAQHTKLMKQIIQTS